jgi:PncC family amidohydrolase
MPQQLLLDSLIRESCAFVAAESCTGGLIAKMITDLPGSSVAFWGGMTTYSNEAKMKLLSVPERTIGEYGAVSRETVIAMCEGALTVSGAGIAAAVSGIAGPDGGSEEKPVGTVWICAGISPERREMQSHQSRANQPPQEPMMFSKRFCFHGGRDLVRRRAAVAALLCAYGLLVGMDVDKTDSWAYI